MRTKLVVTALMLLIAWALKRHHADARAEDLSWILMPTTQMVSVVTGTDFEWRVGEGYFSRDRLFLIEKSCAGVNFMIAAFAMLVLAQVARCGTVASGLGVLAGALAASYVSAIGVNALRIAVAMPLSEHPEWLPALSAADAHRLEGIAVYFGGLVMLHEIWTTVEGTIRRVALPLATYYTVTLLLPLANGAAQSETFVKHAIVVFALPLVVIAGLATVRRVLAGAGAAPVTADSRRPPA